MRKPQGLIWSLTLTMTLALPTAGFGQTPGGGNRLPAEQKVDKHSTNSFASPVITTIYVVNGHS